MLCFQMQNIFSLLHSNGIRIKFIHWVCHFYIFIQFHRRFSFSSSSESHSRVMDFRYCRWAMNEVEDWLNYNIYQIFYTHRKKRKCSKQFEFLSVSEILSNFMTIAWNQCTSRAYNVSMSDQNQWHIFERIKLGTSAAYRGTFHWKSIQISCEIWKLR